MTADIIEIDLSLHRIFRLELHQYCQPFVSPMSTVNFVNCYVAIRQCRSHFNVFRCWLLWIAIRSSNRFNLIQQKRRYLQTRNTTLPTWVLDS